MEIKVYMQLLQKRWWLVLLVLIIALAATAYFTLNMKPLYRAEATYIVRVSASEEERNVISAINTLTSRSEIAATYAGVANSSSIKNMAADDLGISHDNNLKVSSQVQSGTNIVEIGVEGNDPALVRDYTNAIGAQTVKYVESLYETYRLELLDEAVVPSSPSRPSMAQNLTLGGILGLLLGMGLVIFMEYLKIPSDADAMFNILDERIGIYDMRYFRERLHQEMSRSRRHKHRLSIAMINIDHRHLLDNVSPEVRLSAMRSVVTAVGRSLRDEDVMAASSDTELAVLMPELDGERAKIAVERILAIVSKISVELNPTGKTISLNGAAGVAPLYSDERVTTDALLTRAKNALESMRESTYGRVMVSSEGPVPVTEGLEYKSAQPEEQKPPQMIEETVAAEPVEMNATESLVQETVEEEDVLAAEMAESVDDANGHHRKKARNRKPEGNESFSNKLEVSET